MTTGRSDIEIDLSVSGMEAVRSAFASIRSESGAAGRAMEDSIDTADERAVDLNANVEKSNFSILDMVGSIAKISFAAAIAGAAVFAGVVTAAFNVVEETTQKVSDLSLGAAISGLGSAVDLGGFGFALKTVGVEAEAATGILHTLRESAIAALQGDEEAIDSLAAFGVRWEDIVDGNGYLRDQVDMLDRLQVSYVDSEKALDGLYGLMQLFGDAEGVALDRLFKASGGVGKLLQDYRDVSGLTEDDIEEFNAYQAQMQYERLSLEGLKNSFTRGFVGDGITASEARTGALVELQPLIESLGETFGKFALDVGPSVIAVAEKVAEILIEILEYINTGDTDVAWLISLTEAFGVLVEVLSTIGDIFGVVSDAILAFSTFMTEKVLPIFGIELSNTQFITGLAVIIAGLATVGPLLLGVYKSIAGIFSSIFTSIGSIALRIGAINTTVGAVAASAGAALTAAALPAAAVATAIGATYVAVTSTADLEERMTAAAERTNQLADEHGQEYAAAYYKAVLTNIEKEAGAAGLISDFASFFGLGVDFELGIEYSDETIRQGGAEAAGAARAGLAEAFREYGWDIDEGGVIDIGGGLTITGAELSEAVKGDVDNALADLDAEIDISKITGVEAAMNDAMSELMKNSGSFDNLADPNFAATFGNPNVTPVTLVFPGFAPITGLTGTPDAVDQINRALAAARRGAT